MQKLSLFDVEKRKLRVRHYPGSVNGKIKKKHGSRIILKMHSDRRNANTKVGVWKVKIRYGNMFFLQG